MRRAFTLLELMVSVLLLFLIVFFLGRSYATLKTATETGERHEASQSRSHALSQLLVRDILQANELNITAGRDFDVLSLRQVRHSLYGRSRSEVVYAVTKPEKQLIRLEDDRAIALPVSPADAYGVDFLTLPGALKSFKVIKSQKKKEDGNETKGCTLLIFLEPDSKQEPLLLELGLLNHNACQI